MAMILATYVPLSTVWGKPYSFQQQKKEKKTVWGKNFRVINVHTTLDSMGQTVFFQ